MFSAKINTLYRKEKGWLALWWSYLFFWYFSGPLYLLQAAYGTRVSVSLREASIATLLWLIPLLLYPGKSRAISGFLGIGLWLFSLVNLTYFCIYKQGFSQSVIFVISESNSAEASEYISQYINIWIVLAVAAYSGMAIVLWRKVRPIPLEKNTRIVILTAITFAIFIHPNLKQFRTFQFSSALAAEAVENRLEPATPWHAIVGYKRYRDQLEKVQEILSSQADVKVKGLVANQSTEPSTLVMIIGESTNRDHMSLYGYPRKTTPRLDGLRNELAIFNQVISPAAYTIGALQSALIFSPENRETSGNFSLVGLMKQAGYKTYWITNQLTMAKNNTLLTSLSQQADEKTYLNNGKERDSAEFDEKVLEPFTKALEDKEGKKFVVIHLLGTHTKYEYRYPKSFDVFKENTELPEWASNEQKATINSYDNAVLYNDFVVSALIGKMKASKANGFLVYFSDHGEDVFDSPPHTTLGHNEEKPTPPMYKIPFLIWTSEEWKKRHPVDASRLAEQAYSTADLIHTWAVLADLSFDGLDRAKSLVSQRQHSPASLQASATSK